MRRLTHEDLPALRAVRDAYRKLLDAANANKVQESDVGMLMAYCAVIDDLQGRFDGIGRQLSRIERTAPGGAS